MKRPVIGICAAIENARWAAWDVLVNLSPRNYSLAVQRAGALGAAPPEIARALAGAGEPEAPCAGAVHAASGAIRLRPLLFDDACAWPLRLLVSDAGVGRWPAPYRS